VIYRDQQQTIDKKLMVLKENANKCFLLAPLARNHLNICQGSSLMIKATIIRSVITKKKGYVELTNMWFTNKLLTKMQCFYTNTPKKILARSARSLSFIKNAKLLVSRLRSWLFCVLQINVTSINMWFTATNKLLTRNWWF